MEELLQEFGLTRVEAKTYIVLLRLGLVKVGSIIKKSNLQSSTIHNSLLSLIDKGFVTYILKGKIKFYQAIEPKLLLELYKERERKFISVLPELESIKNTDHDVQTAEVYEGIRGIISMLNELLAYSKKGDYYYFFAIDVSKLNVEIQDFFEKYDVKRVDKGLIVRGLAREELRALFNKRKFLNVRYLDFPIPSNVILCGNKVALIDWGDKPSGVLIKSKQIIESEKNFFEELWKRARK
jgi:sugar-specific transcriptional regulator TrmB